MSLLHLFDRALARERQDSTAPLAQPVAELRPWHPGRELDVQLEPGWLAKDVQKAAERMERPTDDQPITVRLADLRACRPDMPIRTPEEDAATVELVLACVVEGWQLSPKGLDRVRGALWAGLEQAGVVT